MDFSKFGKKIQEAASATAKAAGDQVQIAKLQIEKSNANKELNDAFAALGKYCYLNTESADLISKIGEYKSDIDSIKLKIASIENEIENVKQSSSADDIEAEPVEEISFYEEDTEDKEENI